MDALLSNEKKLIVDEPDSDDPAAITLALQMPIAGMRIIRRFSEANFVSHVNTFVQVGQEILC